MREHYSDQEAEEILRVASAKSNTDGLSRQRLFDTAAELGITPEQVIAAEEEVLVRRELDGYRAEYRKEQRGEFASHLVTYLAVNAFLAFIYFMKGGLGIFWPGIVMGGWGIGIVSHAMGTFNTKSEEYRVGFEKWVEKKQKKQRRKEIGQKIQDRAERLISEILTVNPSDRKSAVTNVREQIGLSVDDAKRVVDEYIVKNRLQ